MNETGYEIALMAARYFYSPSLSPVYLYVGATTRITGISGVRDGKLLTRYTERERLTFFFSRELSK